MHIACLPVSLFYDILTSEQANVKFPMFNT